MNPKWFARNLERRTLLHVLKCCNGAVGLAKKREQCRKSFVFIGKMFQSSDVHTTTVLTRTVIVLEVA